MSESIWLKLRDNPSARVGAVLLALYLMAALLAGVLAPYDYDDQDFGRQYQAPSSSHLLGTDDLGRDQFSRVLYGARISLRVGIFAVSISLFAGVLIGALAGYLSGWVDSLLMRAMDVLLAFPSILLALSIVAVLGNDLTNAMIAVGVVGIPVFARLTRATVLTVRESDYVMAARALGAGEMRILFVHILPNCLSPLLVQATLSTGTSVLDAAGLSFLGLGAKPPTPEWGTMLGDTLKYFSRAPWCVVGPGLAIFGMVLAFNLLGDGLRDALDPRVKED